MLCKFFLKVLYRVTEDLTKDENEDTEGIENEK